MEKNIIYHGSNVEVSVPRILQNGFYKDFGYGFYCTSYEKQAKRWALTRRGASTVNHFEVDCRRGIEHDYDIVEGPMADDQIWNFVEGFIDGKIPRDAFWGLVRFNYPTHQIVFCTESALKTLTFEGSETL